MRFAPSRSSQLSCCNQWTPFNDFGKIVRIQTCLSRVTYAGSGACEDIVLVGGKGGTQGVEIERAGDQCQYISRRLCSKQNDHYLACGIETRFTRSKTSTMALLAPSPRSSQSQHIRSADRLERTKASHAHIVIV